MEDAAREFDRRIKSDTELKGGDVAELTSNGWTDEKHMLFLSSMEASFVDQLYNSNNCINCNSRDLLGRSDRRAKLAVASTGDNLFGGQFKVLCEGNWKMLGYARKTNEAGTEDQSENTNSVMLNPWIQRLRSSAPSRNDAQGGHNLDDEVSDQNFVDVKIEGVAESSTMRPKKRFRSCAHNIDA